MTTLIENFWSPFQEFKIGIKEEWGWDPFYSLSSTDPLVKVFFDSILPEAIRSYVRMNGSTDDLPLFSPLYMSLMSDDRSLTALWANHAETSLLGTFVYCDDRDIKSYDYSEMVASHFSKFGGDDWRGIQLSRAKMINAGRIRQIALSMAREEFRISIRRRQEMYVYPIFKEHKFIVDNNLCFVLMPFNEKMRAVYDDHIRPSIEKAGLTCLRADDIFDNKSIVESVWSQINRARLVIADLTDRNPNVFYEVGISHTIGKEVILLTQSLEDVPFDLRHLRIVVYKFTPRGMKEFETSLLKTTRSLVP